MLLCSCLLCMVLFRRQFHMVYDLLCIRYGKSIIFKPVQGISRNIDQVFQCGDMQHIRLPPCKRHKEQGIQPRPCIKAVCKGFFYMPVNIKKHIRKGSPFFGGIKIFFPSYRFPPEHTHLQTKLKLLRFLIIDIC